MNCFKRLTTLWHAIVWFLKDYVWNIPVAFIDMQLHGYRGVSTGPFFRAHGFFNRDEFLHNDGV
jgi:hypothetical protein